MTDECLEHFDAVRKGDARFALFKISDDAKEIILDTSGPRDSTFEDFKNAIPKNECRYAYFDLEFTTPDGS